MLDIIRNACMRLANGLQLAVIDQQLDQAKTDLAQSRVMQRMLPAFIRAEERAIADLRRRQADLIVRRHRLRSFGAAACPLPADEQDTITPGQ